jgi:predicted protein tyrosine phosphatase
MKTTLLALALAAVLPGSLYSQAPAPALGVAPAGAPANAAETLRLLQQMRESNAKLLEQQARTLQLLDEMEKTSQTIKTLGKRG